MPSTYNGSYLNRESCNFSKRFNNISLISAEAKNKIQIDEHEFHLASNKIPYHLSPTFLPTKANHTLPMENQTVYNDETK